MHNAMRVREGTVTITGSHPHSRWSFCAQGHRMLSHYQASYPALLDIATSLSLTKLFGFKRRRLMRRYIARGTAPLTAMRVILTALMLPLFAAAQQPGHVPRIAYLGFNHPTSASEPTPFLDAFRDG